jgi:DNA-binding MltR family transcriptional regulator
MSDAIRSVGGAGRVPDARCELRHSYMDHLFVALVRAEVIAPYYGRFSKDQSCIATHHREATHVRNARARPAMSKRLHIPTPEELHTPANWRALINAMSGQHELLSAIVLTTFIEQNMMLIVLYAFKTEANSNTAKKLLNPNGGALGNLQARADLAYCLGLIDSACKTNLEQIAAIRNEFAHRPGVTFNDERIVEYCERFVVDETNNPNAAIKAELIATRKKLKMSPVPPYRSQFETMAMGVGFELAKIAFKMSKKSSVSFDDFTI